jgi:hypothetical protein
VLPGRGSRGANERESRHSGRDDRVENGSANKCENREESFKPVEITGARLGAGKEIVKDLFGVLCAGAQAPAS